MKSHKDQNVLNGKSEDKKLFTDVKKKDQEAFIKAYDLYVDQIYRFIYFKVGNKPDEAQDLTSTVFLKTWNYIQSNSLKEFKTLRALIYKIARTSIIDHYRKSTINIRIDDETRGLDLPDHKQDLAKQSEIISDFEIIASKLNALKDEYREVIVLRFINELSTKEIARVIDKSKGNVRVLIHRALKALKDLVDDDSKINH